MGDRKFSINSDFTDQLQFPKLKEVRAWLDLNEIASTQPFTAFADAFEKAGADSTSIKVDRANREVCDRAADWALLPIIKHWCASTAKRAENAKVRLASANQSLAASGGSPHLTSAASAAPQQESNTSGSTTQETGWNEINNTVLAFFALLSDFALFLFRAALWLLADHGYRPGKVLLWVSVTLFVYWVVFLVGLKIVGFSPMRKTAARAAPAGEGKPSQEVSSGAANPTGANATPTATQPAPATGTEPSQEASTVAPSTTLVNATSTAKPLGLLFFIDRLLPAYQIVEAHYKIDKYYKWTRGASNPSAEVRRLWFFKLPVEEVKGERELVRIESWLTVLRVVGLIYAIFLAAAVSALVVH